jgi:hypothetical protein
MSNSELKQILSNRFSGYSVSPTADVWTNIEANLDEDDRQRKGIFFWLFDGIAAASVVALIAYSLAYSTNSGVTEHVQVTEKVLPTKEKRPTEDQLGGITPLAHSKDSTSVKEENLNTQVLAKSTTQQNKIDFFSPGHKDLTDKRQENPIIESKPEHERMPLIQAELYDVSPIPNDINNKLIIAKLSGPSKPRHSRWAIGLDLTGFVNTTFPGSDGLSSISAEIVVPTQNNSNMTSSSKHIRFLELRAFVERKFGRRISVGAGISSAIASSNYTETTDDAGIMSTYELLNDYWSIGIPVHAHYDILQKNRWNVHAGGAIQPEFRFASTKTSTENYSGTSSLAAADTQNKNGSFQLGIQPYLGTDFYASSSMKISFQAGYRSYLLRDLSLQNKGLDPNYFTASLGVSWML